CELHGEDGCLERVETAVPSDFLVVIALAAAVIAQQAKAVGKFIAVRGHASRVTIGAEVLRGIEAEGGQIPNRSSPAPPPGCSKGLGGVFDDGELRLLAEAEKLVHVGAESVEMHGKDGFEARMAPVHEALDGFGIEIQRERINVGEYGTRR